MNGRKGRGKEREATSHLIAKLIYATSVHKYIIECTLFVIEM